MWCPKRRRVLLPEDWPERVRTNGDHQLSALPPRIARTTYQPTCLPPLTARLLMVSSRSDTIADFLGLGLGYMLLMALSDAMEHEHLVESNAFWQDIQQAVAATQQEHFDGGSPPYIAHLQSAATRLLAARERLYPTAIHLLDFVLLEDQDFGDPWPITVGHGQPINVIASSSVLVKLRLANAEGGQVPCRGDPGGHGRGVRRRLSRARGWFAAN